MHNHQLDTLIAVVEYGSFNKAAESLYISPNAVMKQINQLENTIGIKIFDRTHRGLIITESGKSLYEDAKYIVEYSQAAINRAQKIEKGNHHIRIGISIITPVSYILLLCLKYNTRILIFNMILFHLRITRKMQSKL